MKRILLALTLVFASLQALAATDQPLDLTLPATPPKSDATVLPGVTVQKKQDPLSRSDRRLARVKKSLPGPGEGKPPVESTTDKAQDYLEKHADPNAATGEQRQMMKDSQRPPGPLKGSDPVTSP